MDELSLNVILVCESVQHDELLAKLGAICAPLRLYDDTTCRIHTQLTLPQIREFKKHRDVMRVKVTTTTFQLHQMLKARYEEYDERSVNHSDPL